MKKFTNQTLVIIEKMLRMTFSKISNNKKLPPKHPKPKFKKIKVL